MDLIIIMDKTQGVNKIAPQEAQCLQYGWKMILKEFQIFK